MVAGASAMPPFAFWICCSILTVSTVVSYDKYFLGPTTSVWDEAESYCVSQGSHLASIHSASDNTYALSMCGNATTCWLGINDLSSEGTYVWSDGTSYDYSNWNPGEPYDPGFSLGQAGEHCGELAWSGGGGWNDSVCSTSYRYPLCNVAHEYVYVSSSMNYSTANTYCANTYGTQLATITNDDEATTIMNLTTANGASAWVGLNDIDSEGTFLWDSGYSWLSEPFPLPFETVLNLFSM